jgi:hypothetical protein
MTTALMATAIVLACFGTMVCIVQRYACLQLIDNLQDGSMLWQLLRVL